MLRPRFGLYLLALLAVYLTMNYSAYDFLFPVLIFLLLLPLLSLLALLISRQQVRLELRFSPARAPRGTEHLLRFRVENRGFLPLTLRLHIQLLSPARARAGLEAAESSASARRMVGLAMAPREEKRFAISYVPRHREQLGCDLSGSRVSDLFGFFRLRLPQSVTAKIPGTLVWPQKIALETTVNVLSQDNERELFDTTQTSTVIDEIARLREYAPGDKLRQIHWSVSAHLPELQVREFIDPYRDPVALLVPLISKNSVVKAPSGDPADLALRLNDGCGDLAAAVAAEVLGTGLPLRLYAAEEVAVEAHDYQDPAEIGDINDRLSLQLGMRGAEADRYSSAVIQNSWGLEPLLLNLASAPPGRLVVLTFGLTSSLVQALLKLLQSEVQVTVLELLAARQAVSPGEGLLRQRLQRAGGSFMLLTLSEILAEDETEQPT